MTGKLCIVTMIGGIDVLGELPHDYQPQGFELLRNPVRFGIVAATRAFQIIDMPVLATDFIEINMAAIMWIMEPPKALASAYRLRRAGLTLPEKQLESLQSQISRPTANQ